MNTASLIFIEKVEVGFKPPENGKVISNTLNRIA